MRLLRGLGGRVLPCGCLVGVYETYDGEVVSTIDVRGGACAERDHRLHAIVPTMRDAGTIRSGSAPTPSSGQARS